MEQTKNEMLLEQLVQVLQGARTAAWAITQQIENGDTIALTIDTKLKQSIDFIGGLTNKIYTGTEIGRVELPPVTKMWGQDIKPGGRRITQEDIKPDVNERDIFIARRNQLYDTWIEKDNTDLGMIITQPRGEALLRSVALMADYPGYQTDLINTDFFNKVRDNIRYKKERDAAEQEAVQFAFTPNPGSDTLNDVAETTLNDAAKQNAEQRAGGTITSEPGSDTLNDTSLASPEENDKRAADLAKEELEKVNKSLTAATEHPAPTERKRK